MCFVTHLSQSVLRDRYVQCRLAGHTPVSSYVCRSHPILILCMSATPRPVYVGHTSVSSCVCRPHPSLVLCMSATPQSRPVYVGHTSVSSCVCRPYLSLPMYVGHTPVSSCVCRPHLSLVLCMSATPRVRKVAIFPIFRNLEFLFCEIFDYKE